MMRRFVILRHDRPFLHWDLLLEDLSTARGWRLLREPSGDEPIAAQPLPPHRLLYLDYEGPVSGNRGVVQRAVSGSYAIDADFSESLQILFAENSLLTAGQLQILNDGRQFWTFETR